MQEGSETLNIAMYTMYTIKLVVWVICDIRFTFKVNRDDSDTVQRCSFTRYHSSSSIASSTHIVSCMAGSKSGDLKSASPGGIEAQSLVGGSSRW